MTSSLLRCAFRNEEDADDAHDDVGDAAVGSVVAAVGQGGNPTAGGGRGDVGVMVFRLNFVISSSSSSESVTLTSGSSDGDVGGLKLGVRACTPCPPGFPCGGKLSPPGCLPSNDLDTNSASPSIFDTVIIDIHHK